MKELAQPQTILAKDGFPIENHLFCGGAQEIMAIIQGNKPVAATDFDIGYIHYGMTSSLKSKKKKISDHKCYPYTYEDVYKASKKVKLLRRRYGNNKNFKTYYYFLDKTIQDAYLLSLLWGDKSDSIIKQYGLNDNETHILIGILLGYKKKDIFAWFLGKLEEIKGVKFDDLNLRSSLLKNPKLQQAKELNLNMLEFEWNSTQAKLVAIRKETQVPASWKRSITTLPPPGTKTRKQKHTT